MHIKFAYRVGSAGIVIKSGHRRVARCRTRRLLPNPSPERNHPTRRHRDWRTRTRPGGGAPSGHAGPRPRRAGPRPCQRPLPRCRRQHRVGGRPRRQAGTPLGTAQRAVDCAWLIRRWMVLPNRLAVTSNRQRVVCRGGSSASPGVRGGAGPGARVALPAPAELGGPAGDPEGRNPLDQPGAVERDPASTKRRFG